MLGTLHLCWWAVDILRPYIVRTNLLIFFSWNRWTLGRDRRCERRDRE